MPRIVSTEPALATPTRGAPVLFSHQAGVIMVITTSLLHITIGMAARPDNRPECSFTQARKHQYFGFDHLVQTGYGGRAAFRRATGPLASFDFAQDRVGSLRAASNETSRQQISLNLVW